MVPHLCGHRAVRLLGLASLGGAGSMGRRRRRSVKPLTLALLDGGPDGRAVVGDGVAVDGVGGMVVLSRLAADVPAISTCITRIYFEM